MILVDIYVPSVCKEYNFSLNETVTISTIIEEIAEMIGQKEQTFLKGQVSEMMLCDKNLQTVFRPDTTLTDSGIRTGASLILI